MSVALRELEAAWKKREQWDVFADRDAARVFHGPGESAGELREIAIDRLGEHYWITEWARCPGLATVSEFLRSKGAVSAVHLFRPTRGVPGDPEVLFGNPPREKFSVHEGSMNFRIQLLGTKHPGLFLDHAPLREWLFQNSESRRVLNTFAYTGSLSVAAGLGGASQVTTLDLSKPTIEWARENWDANRLSSEKADFIYGDYFEWLPRLVKNERRFEGVILDPPSFSRGKKGDFSTAKDLKRLHELAFDALEKGGFLATSINSAGVTRKKYFGDIQAAAKSRSRKLEIIREIELPRTFPTPPSSEADRYLKGWILKVV